MKSQRQIEKRFKLLMEDVATNDYYKIDINKRVNCYSCKCGHITKTIDVDPGCTPFMFNCEKCGLSANSSFYTDVAPDQQPTFEWYRPDLKEVLKMRKKPYLLDHIFNGGLTYRKITPTP